MNYNGIKYQMKNTNNDNNKAASADFILKDDKNSSINIYILYVLVSMQQ